MKKTSIRLIDLKNVILENKSSLQIVIVKYGTFINVDESFTLGDQVPERKEARDKPLVPLDLEFTERELIPWYPPVAYVDQRKNSPDAGMDRIIGLSISVEDQKGVLLEVSRIFFEEDISIRHLTVLRTPEERETRIYILWRCTGDKLGKIMEKLKSLSTVKGVKLIGPAGSSLWVNTEIGPSMLDPVTGNKLIVLRKKVYKETIKALFEKTGAILVIPYYHQMFNYGRQVAKWYLTHMKGSPPNKVLSAAATIYRALGLGFIRRITTGKKCYEIAVEDPYDPPGYCCPGTRGIIAGFLSELNNTMLRSEPSCREDNSTCIFRICAIY